MHRIPITVQLERFEGPLDLLLHLIQSHEMDISKISISKITDQYLSYVKLMQELNFDLASEFLVMAATLIFWKSKALLPQEKMENQAQELEGELSQEDLIRQLLEHQRFQAAGELLSQRPLLGEDVFTRQNAKPPIERIWREMNLTDLALSYQDIAIRARKRVQILKKETVSLGDKILEFSNRLIPGKLTYMGDLISDLSSRAETVVTFLASLELSRLKKLKLYQQEVYQNIYLELFENLVGFDTRLASGFDPMTQAQEIKPETMPDTMKVESL